MENLKDMKMIDIMDKVNIILNGVDQIYYFYNNENRKQKIEDLKKKMKKDTHAVYEFLIENSNDIDKEKFILVLAKNHIDNLKIIDKKIREIKINLSNTVSINNEEKIKLKKELDDYIVEKKEKEENLKNVRKLGRYLDTIFTVYYFDEEKEKYNIDLFDSEILLKGKQRSSYKQIEKYNKVDEQLKKIFGDENGINLIFQSILLSDFNQIFEDEKFANIVRAYIIDNGLISNKIKTREEIEELRQKNFEEYDAAGELLDYNKIVIEMRKKIEEYIEYLDIDKILLVSACKIEDLLETGLVDEKYFEGEKAVLECIYENLGNNKKEYTFDLYFNSNRDNNYTRKIVTYSKKDIERCLKRFTKNSYITKNEIEEKREKIQKGSLNISDLEYDEINAIYTDEELKNKEDLSDNDFVYLSERLNWDKQTILENLSKNKKGCSKDLIKYFLETQKIEYKDIINLYLCSTIDMNKFKDICKEIDVSELINIKELISLYNETEKKGQDERNLEKYNRYIILFKEYTLKDKEKSKYFSEDLMENLIEDYDEKNKTPYINQIEEFFKQGLISLDTLVEWNSEDIIKKVISDMYVQDVISLEIIKRLIESNILKYEYLEEIVKTEGLESDKLIEILNEGFIDENTIFDLYAKKSISEEQLISLGNKDIIDSRKVNKILGIKRDELETDEQYMLLISGALQKIKTEKSGGHSKGGSKIDKRVINPDRRLEFFDLFGARKYEAVLPNSSPFYNYDFFVIPDKNGNYKNGIVIAERIYEEKPEHLKKNEEIKYATDNATYIFQSIEDIKIIKNSEKQNKTEAIKRKNGIIKRVNHVLADGRKNGRWAFDMRDAIMKIMIGSDLKEYSKANQSTIINQKLREVYGVDTWMKITNKAAQIDCGNDHRNVDNER